MIKKEVDLTSRGVELDNFTLNIIAIKKEEI